MSVFKLEDLELDAIALVDQGANQEAHVTLYKRGVPGGEEMAAETATPDADLEQELATVTEERDALRAQIEELGKAKKPFPPSKDKDEDEEEDEEEDEMKKSLTAPLRKRIDEQAAEIAKLQANAELGHYTEVAKGFPGFGTADEFAPVLRVIGKSLDETQYAWFVQHLTALHKQADRGLEQRGTQAAMTKGFDAILEKVVTENPNLKRSDAILKARRLAEEEEL